MLCEECENGLDVGKAKTPDALSGACHGIPCLHPCALDYYPGLIRSISSPTPVALLTLVKSLKRDRHEYGGPAAWVSAVVERYHQYAPDQNLFTVIENNELTSAAIKQAELSGASGYLVAIKPIDQSWKAVGAQEPGGRSEHVHP